jgi:flagellar biosynthesis component FlhA
VERQYFPVQGGETQLRTLNYHLATVNDDLNHDFYTILETEIFLKKPGQTMIFLVSQLRKEVMEKITDLYTRNNEIGIFLIKSRLEKVKPEEAALLEYAKGKGLNAKVVRESDFTKAFER